jgi:hypothetical protein
MKTKHLIQTAALLGLLSISATDLAMESQNCTNRVWGYATVEVGISAHDSVGGLFRDDRAGGAHFALRWAGNRWPADWHVRQPRQRVRVHRHVARWRADPAERRGHPSEDETHP